VCAATWDLHDRDVERRRVVSRSSDNERWPIAIADRAVARRILALGGTRPQTQMVRLSPRFRSLVVIGSAWAAVLLAVLAESAGTQRHPAVNLVAGCAFALGGLFVLSAGTAWLAGLLLVCAAVTRYVATAGIADDVAFLHRAFLVHALIAITVAAGGSGATRSAALRAGRWGIVGVAYVVALDRDLSVATSWTLAVGLGAIVVTVVAGVAGRWSWLLVVAASVGTATWTLAASVVRTSGWFDVSTRLQFYVGGLVAVVVSIAVWASCARRAARLSSGDLVRDDGRGGVRIAFRGEHGEFEDIAGERFASAPGESTVLVDLGDDLGEVLLAHNSAPADTGALTPGPLDDRMTDGLRLVAINHRAVQTLRSRAADVAASAQRLRIADELAAAELGLELERMVVSRIERAVEALDGDPSEVAAQARGSLALVVGEIEGLAAGLAPAGLDRGLRVAFAAIADPGLVSVCCDVDDSAIDRSSALILYLVATECVTNALRHGVPSLVTVDLHDDGRRGDMVELTVMDDGRGGAEARVDGSGGLAGLRSRVDAASGGVEVAARPGGGTVVTVRLPRRVPSSVPITPL
jgi:signal transduction histidine kinase